MKPEFDLIGFNRDVQDLESVPFAVCLLNLDGTYAYANPAYLELVGVAQAGFGVLAGSPFDCGLADPTANEEMRRALVDTLDHGDEYATVARIRGGEADASQAETYHRISARRLGEDRLLVLTRPVLSAHDILLAERDEEIQRLSRWRKEFLQNSPHLVITHDLDGFISFANAAAEEALGASRGELIGRDLAAFVTPAYASRYFAYIEELERRPSTRGLLEVRGAYGETRSWRYQASISIDGENPPAATTQIIDVTNEVQLLQALQESELRLHRLVAADERPIWITDQSGLCLFANDAAAETTRSVWADPAGVSIEQLLPGCDMTELLATGTAHIVDPSTADMKIMVLDALDLGDSMIRIAAVERDQDHPVVEQRAAGGGVPRAQPSISATLAEMDELLPQPPGAMPLATFLDQIEAVAQHLLSNSGQPEHGDQAGLVPVAAALLRYWGTVEPPDIDAIWRKIDSALDEQTREPSQILRPIWPGESNVGPNSDPVGGTAAAIVIAAAIVSATMEPGDRAFEINPPDPATKSSEGQDSAEVLAIPEELAGEEPKGSIPNVLPRLDLSDRGGASSATNNSAETGAAGNDADTSATVPTPREARDQLRQNIWEIAGIEPELPDSPVTVRTSDSQKSGSKTDTPPTKR